MKLPRDVSADRLCRALRRLEYFPDRQSGSHLTLVHEARAEWQVGFPIHKPLKVGMLHRALEKVAEQQDMTLVELIARLKL